MFKKITLLLVLLAVLVAVSYYKTTTQDARVETAYNDGKADAVEQIGDLKNTNDSLSSKLRVRDDELAETRTALDTIRIAQTDSLTNLIETKDKELAEFANVKDSQESKAIATKSDTTSNRHREILAHYKKLYKGLPRDLSAYERRITLSEIRQESASKFQISVADLNKIRNANNLGY